MFDIDDFVSACVQSGAESEPHLAVRDVVRRALERPDDVLATLRPTEGGLRLLHNTAELTVVDVVWAPRMRIYPHDHRMWAAIGIYTGQEDNTFFRRRGPGHHAITESGHRSLETGEVRVLGDDTIHAVANPKDRLTGAIHVYGGDFVNQPRSQWGSGPLKERPYDTDEVRQLFAEANRAWRDAGR